MIPLWWSLLLAVVGIVGLWVAGSGKGWGWLVGLAAQILWIAYALATTQYGFIASALAYGFVYARNARRARVRSSERGALRPADRRRPG
jgi:nicotinamide riboside transporter PnuC